jgi:hypothetical protein
VPKYDKIKEKRERYMDNRRKREKNNQIMEEKKRKIIRQ